MHLGHDHHHRDGATAHAGVGHNQRQTPRTAQWQTPHLAEDEHATQDKGGEPDLDLVEAAFVEGFTLATDPTSFLRLARVPFEAQTPDGARVVLLRVEVESMTDVGGVTPHLGGGSFRYDPLPAQITSRRRRLRFVYFDGAGLKSLGLPEVRSLREVAGEVSNVG